MKRLVFHLRNALDPERVDRIEIPEGTTLRDTSDARNRPLISVGAIVRVELVEDAEQPPAPEGVTA